VRDLILMNLNREGACEARYGNYELGSTSNICLKTGKTKKTCVEMASGRTYWIHTDSPTNKNIQTYPNVFITSVASLKI
jgi:hypothetical protein